MCLHLETSSKSKKADKPIVVYKLLTYKRGKALSWVHEYYYKPNTLQPKVKINKYSNYVEDGYHSRKNFFGQINNAVFVIPKGAEYYEGKENWSTIDNYVSDTIIYVGYVLNPLTWVKLIYYKWIR